MSQRKEMPKDIKEIRAIITKGELFKLQTLLSEGRRVRCEELEENAACCLIHACKGGFHSIMEVLLRSATWTQREKNEALDIALSNKRIDLVELLLSHGADPQTAHFGYVAKIADVGLMERFFAAGCDPEYENRFAYALDETKARPLLRFLRTHIEEFPGLRKQASFALALAIEDNHPGWASMLVWAGADPLMRVPDKYDQGWDLDEHKGQIPAEEACRSENPALLKVLRLKPSVEQIKSLLNDAAEWGSLDVLQTLLKILPREKIKEAISPHCEIITSFLTSEDTFFWRLNKSAEDRVKERISRLEALLEVGAKWSPKEEELRTLRKSFLKLNKNYIIRVIRMLLYVPEGANRKVVLDFCDTNPILWTIRDTDKALYGEIKAMIDSYR